MVRLCWTFGQKKPPRAWLSASHRLLHNARPTRVCLTCMLMPDAEGVSGSSRRWTPLLLVSDSRCFLFVLSAPPLELRPPIRQIASVALTLVL